MKTFLFLSTVILTICLFQCKNNNQNDKAVKIDPFESATPHGQALNPSELSDADREKLAVAKGRSAILINKGDIDSLLKYSDDKLYIYSFFKIDSSACTQVNNALIELQKESGDSTLKLVFFSLDTPDKLNEVNSNIRETGVTSDVFFTSDTLDEKWYNRFDSKWSGEVPAIYLINQNDGTKIFYQKSFTLEELQVLIQPLLM